MKKIMSSIAVKWRNFKTRESPLMRNMGFMKKIGQNLSKVERIPLGKFDFFI